MRRSSGVASGASAAPSAAPNRSAAKRPGGDSSVRFSSAAAADDEDPWGAPASDNDGGASDDSDRLEVVARGGGGAGASKRRRRSSAGPRGRASSSAGAAARAAAAGEAVSASALVNDLSSRYARAAAGEGVAPALMSSVSRRENAAQLSYFEQLAQPAKRSTNTLRDVPKLSEEQRASIAASLPPRHAAEKARLLSHYTAHMREWYLSLSSGAFNLLCYGYGSKKHLLTQFARTWLTDGPVIVFNAYAPGANVKSLLNSLTRDLMHLPTQTFRDLHAHAEFVRDWFRKDALQARGGGRRAMRAQMARGGMLSRAAEEAETATWSEDEEQPDAAPPPVAAAALLPRVYVLLHNIDGASLRTEAQQQVLSLLASIPQIRLVASVDHIRAGWLWDQAMLTAFNFLALDCTTFADYVAEHASNAGAAGAGGGGADGADGGLVESSQRGRAAGIANVLSSLTPNHRKVLDLLAHVQLEPSNPDTAHMLLKGPGAAAAPYPLVIRARFEDACMDAMLVSSSTNFERLLTELRDHALLAERTVDKTKALCIPYAEPVIRRHVLGEAVDDAVVDEAARADEQAERRAARSREDSAFARAAGADDDAEAEEDEVDEAEMDAAEEAADESE